MEETIEQQSYGYSKRPLWQWILLYILIGGAIYGLIYYFVLAKKSGYNTSSNSPSMNATSPTAMPVSPTQAMASEMIVKLAAENNSSESGTATLKEDNGKTTVTINVTGFAKDVSQPAHIHVGACPGVGAVKYPLTDVMNGQSASTIAATLAQLKQQLPLAINIHKSKTAIASYTACGPLSAQQ